MSPKLSQLLYTQLSPSGATFKHTKNGFWIENTGVCRECNWVTEAASFRPIVRSVITTANNFSILWCRWQPCHMLNYFYFKPTSPHLVKRQHVL